MRKKICSFVATILLLIFAVFLMTACFEEETPPEYAWGKSFTFQGVFIDNKETRYGNESGSPIAELLKKEYNKSNLDFANATVNGVKYDLTAQKGANADEFISNLDALAKAKLYEKYKGFKVTVGTEEEKTIKINDKVCNVVKTEGAPMCYVADQSGTNIGTFDPLISANVNGKTKGCFGLMLFATQFDDLYGDVWIDIPTIEISSDMSVEKQLEFINGTETVVSTSVRLHYIPYFSKAE